MPILGAPVTVSPIGAASGAVVGAGSGGAPVPGAKIPPLADSAVVYEYSYSTGTGPYQLTGAFGSWKRFRDGYEDGAQVYYRATDKSGKTEWVVGVFHAADNTLSRDIILGSTNSGNPINWTGRTRVLVHGLVRGLPLCTDTPQDGDVPTWAAALGEYCPRAPTAATDDDDTADMQNVETGPVYRVPLNKVVSQVIWRWPTGVPMFTNIPAPSAANNGYSLDIKLTENSGQTNTVTPDPPGTIGGQTSWTFTDDHVGGCNMFLRSDFANNDWVIRCICCIDGSEPPATPPVIPSSVSPVIMPIVAFNPLSGYAPPANPFVFSTQFLPVSVTADATRQSQVVVALVMSGFGAAVGGVTSTGATLTFAKRASVSAGVGDMELWWADARGVGPSTTITITADVGGVAHAPGIGVGIVTGPVLWTAGSPWDTNGSLPKLLTGNSADFPVTGFSTTSYNSLPVVFMGSLSRYANPFGQGNVAVMPPEAFVMETASFVGETCYAISGDSPSLNISRRAAFHDPSAPPGAYSSVSFHPFANVSGTTTVNPDNVDWVMIADAIAGM